MRSPKLNKPVQPRQRLPANLYLMFAFVLTMLLGTVSFASYAAETGGEDGVGVAKFQLTATPSTDGDLTIRTGYGETAASYQFNVSNGSSEVSMGYQITVTVPQIVPDWLSFTLQPDGEAEPRAPTSTTQGEEKTTFVFDGANSFPPGESQTHPYTLIIAVDEEKMESANVTDPDPISGIALSVTATQMD